MSTLDEMGVDREGMPRHGDGTLDLGGVARRLLEDVVNAVMDGQASELCADGNMRNGYRERTLNTQVGPITLRIPKLREGTYFPDDVIAPYSRGDRALVAMIAEMYVNGVSTRKVERVAAEMGVERASRSQVSAMRSSLDDEVADLRGRHLGAGAYPYLWLDATYVRCRDGGRVQSKALVTAVAAGCDGTRSFVGLGCVDTESRDSWKAFLRQLRSRGMPGVECVVSDDHAGLVAAAREVFPGSTWQRCITHLERDLSGRFRRRADRDRAMRAVKAVFAERSPELVREMCRRACRIVGGIEPRAGELMEEAEADALAYLDFPREHHLWLRTNNIQERASREIKRRTRVVQVFPSTGSLGRLVGAVCCEVNDEWSCMSLVDAPSLAHVDRGRLVGMVPGEETKARAEALLAVAVSRGRGGVGG